MKLIGAGYMWVICGLYVGYMWVICGLYVGYMWVICGLYSKSIYVMLSTSLGIRFLDSTNSTQSY